MTNKSSNVIGNHTGNADTTETIAMTPIAAEPPIVEPVVEHRHQDRRAITPHLSARRQWALWITVFMLVATGAAWLWAEYAYMPAEDGMEAYELKHYTMVVHAGFALLFVFAAGTLLYTHMQAAWLQGRNRFSGVIMAGTASVLLLSGYGLWYAGGETLRYLCEVSHWATGFAIPVVLLIHGIIGKRRKR